VTQKLLRTLRRGVPLRDLEDGSNGWEFDIDTADKTMKAAADIIESLTAEGQEERGQVMTATQDTLIERAWNCDQWPAWLDVVVDATNKVADEHDMSSEQAIAYGILTALADRDAKIAELERERDRRNFVQTMTGPTAQDKAQVWQSQAEDFAAKLDTSEAQVAELLRERSETQQKLERATEALEPFARLAAHYADDTPDDHPAESIVPNVGDLRRARAFLNSNSPDGKGASQNG